MLKVEHVSYRYPNGERDVLQDVCCTLEDGQLSARLEAEKPRYCPFWPVWTARLWGACPLTGRIIKAWTWTGAAGSGSP